MIWALTPIRLIKQSVAGWDPTDPDPRNPWLKLRPTIKGIANKTIERTNRRNKRDSQFLLQRKDL